MGKRAVAQPGIQLGKQLPESVELSGMSCKFYCSGKYQRDPLSALQLNLFLPETLIFIE